MRILNLILYSETLPQYKAMKGLLQLYLTSLPNVSYYFYCFDETLKVPMLITDHTIRFRGRESFIPGILDKTLKALSLALSAGWQFDYLVRTNISTVVNLRRLTSQLTLAPFHWGGWVRTSVRRDATKGITAQRPLLYVSGTCMIFSKPMVTQIVACQHLIDRQLIDDVALAFLARRLGRELVNVGRVVMNGEYVATKLIYRNRMPDRSQDVARMMRQVTALLKNK